MESFTADIWGRYLESSEYLGPTIILKDGELG